MCQKKKEKYCQKLNMLSIGDALGKFGTCIKDEFLQLISELLGARLSAYNTCILISVKLSEVPMCFTDMT